MRVLKLYSFKCLISASNALLTGFLVLFACTVLATQVAPPEDPTQSMRYWQPMVISPDQDTDVASAHQVFDQLLRAWDQGRIAPSLQVVKSAQGPWAASLADGNILLSREAINITNDFGKQRSSHLLAFILAHELAHQKTNDLWHQQFFRMVGSQSKGAQEKLLQGLNLPESGFDNLEAIETQADQDAVVLMTSVGFDAHLILKDSEHNDSNFYQTWVENIWKSHCHDDDKMKSVCEQALLRGLRTQVQIKTMAEHSVLYKLALQSLVAQNYEQARSYLTAYGRNYPSRVVHNALGLSYLAEAMPLWQQKMKHKYDVELWLPLHFDSEQVQNTLKGKRGANELDKKIQKLVQQSIHYFKQAQTLAPKHPSAYMNLAMAYLMENNKAMVEGTVRGQYQREFGKDLASEFLLIMASGFSYEGELIKADALKQTLEKLSETVVGSSLEKGLSKSAIEYAIYFNLAGLSDESESKNWWQKYAQAQMEQGDTALFKMALSNINAYFQPNLQSNLNPNNQRLKTQSKACDVRQYAKTPISTLWVNGNPLAIHQLENGYWLAQAKEKEIDHCWLPSSYDGDTTHYLTPLANIKKQDQDKNQVKLGDDVNRLFIRLGQPNRRLDLTSGRYLAYDQHKLAFKVQNNKVVEWFYYGG